ncbi:MAG: DEAD/DEAH box helicase [Spirochaetota bacterium]
MERTTEKTTGAAAKGAREKRTDAERSQWLYYTRHPLTDAYRDNLYRDRYRLTIQLSVKEGTPSQLGVALKLHEDAAGWEARVNDLEHFLFSTVLGEEQDIGDAKRIIEIEDLTALDARIVRFLDGVFRAGSHRAESYRLWLTDTRAADLIRLIREHRNTMLDGKPALVSDDVLSPSISGTDEADGSLVVTPGLSPVEESAEAIPVDQRILTFGALCPFVLAGRIFHLTEPSYPKFITDYFSTPCVIPASYRADFHARVVPAIKKQYRLTLPDHADAPAAFPVSPLVFLDYDGTSVHATIKFKYGKTIIEPYVSRAKEPPEVKHIYRDKEKEEFFCATLARYLERDGEYTFSTKDDERIFTLSYRMLPLLQEKGWTFFYSEAFKSLRVNVKPPKLSVSITKDIDFFEVNFSLDGVKELQDISSLIQNVRAGKEYIRLQSGSFVPVDKEVLSYIATLMNNASLAPGSGSSYLLPLFNAPHFVEELEKHSGVALDVAPKAKESIGDIRSSEYDESPPDGITGTFRPYQLAGYQWLRKLSAMKLSGILADDMGLGKSFQTIASILKEKQSGASAPSLIVCPTSCVLNWLMELKKFAPSLTASVIQGTTERREKRIRNLSHTDVGITSYASIRRDVSRYEGMKLTYVILDEAQHIKNANTQNAKAAKAIASEKRLVLTGTPMENSVSELWSIFDFLMPGFFPRHSEFVTQYEAPILSENNTEALGALKRKIAPFILRRLKKDVLPDLPPKLTSVAYCDLTKDQKELYLSILDAARIEIFDAVKKKGFQNAKIEIFSALTRLRQVSCHPLLLDISKRGASHTSGKFKLFMELIDEVLDGGHRVIVFSQFTKMLKIIREALIRRSIGHLYLDGATQNRMELVNRFNAGEVPVFLLSLRAAGTGLTLTAADTVMHFDPWWNPMVEDQATDRAYRIGQTRTVTTYKLVTKGTIEEKILLLQDKKRTLIDSVIDKGGGAGKLSWDDVKSLLG